MPRKKANPDEQKAEELTTINSVAQDESTSAVHIDKDVEDKYQSILEMIGEFGNNDFGNIDDYEQWQSILAQYEKISNAIHAIADDETINKDLREYISQDLYGELSAVYDDFYLSFTKWNIVHVKNIEEKIEKTQVMNFTVFSIFMTILTFLLANITVGSRTDFDLKKMVITNLTLLLIAAVLFAFIGVFMGFLGKGNKRGFKLFIIFALPVVICIGLVLVTVFMR